MPTKTLPFATVGGVPLFALLYGGNLGVVGWAVPVIVIVMMLGLAVRIEIARGGERFRGPRLVFMGAAYVGFLFPFFALLRNSPNGIYILLLVILDRMRANLAMARHEIRNFCASLSA